MPRWHRQSGRLVVTSRSSTVSRSSTSLSGCPGAPVSRMRMPAASSPTPSSIAEHSIPGDRWPRIVRTPSRSSIAGGRVPGGAYGTRWPDLEVRRTRDDAHRTVAARPFRKRGRRRGSQVDVGELQVRGPGDRNERCDPADHEAGAGRFDRSHLGAGLDERAGDSVDGRIERRVIAKPAQRNPHVGAAAGAATGWRKRTSLSYSSRMSVIPHASIAARSMPIPNAKPEYRPGSTPPLRST